MNNTTIGLVSGIALAGMSLYWRRREQTVRESLTVSRDWKPNTNANDTDREERQAAQEAAEHLDARVEDLPKRIASLDEERRDLRRELDVVREQWADSWWKSHLNRSGGTDDSPIHVVEFDHGELPDARAFAKRAMNEEGITLIAAHRDGSLAVAVGEGVSPEFNATDIANEITDEIGGGAGGTGRLATGGGTTGALSEECLRMGEKLERVMMAPNPASDGRN